MNIDLEKLLELAKVILSLGMTIEEAIAHFKAMPPPQKVGDVMPEHGASELEAQHLKNP